MTTAYTTITICAGAKVLQPLAEPVGKWHDVPRDMVITDAEPVGQHYRFKRDGVYWFVRAIYCTVKP
jgi:hypothetical protein